MPKAELRCFFCNGPKGCQDGHPLFRLVVLVWSQALTFHEVWESCFFDIKVYSPLSHNRAGYISFCKQTTVGRRTHTDLIFPFFPSSIWKEPCKLLKKKGFSVIQAGYELCCCSSRSPDEHLPGLQECNSGRTPRIPVVVPVYFHGHSLFPLPDISFPRSRLER